MAETNAVNAAKSVRLPALVLAALVLASCSLSTFDSEPCVVDDDCRSVFGANAVCGGEGLCAVAAVDPRCANTVPEDLLERPERYPGVLVYGSLFDRSESRQVARENAARLAIIQANEEGGLLGRPLAMVFCNIAKDDTIDTLSQEQAAISSAQHLVDVFGVPAIVGPSGSSTTLAVFNALKDRGTLIISPAASGPALTDAEPAASDDSPGLLWRTVAPDILQGAVIAGDINRRGVTNLGIIHQAGAYGEGLRAAVLEELSAGVTVTEFSGYTKTTERDEAIAIMGGSAGVTEVLFISSNSEDVRAFYTAAAGSVNYNNKSLFLTDSAASADLIDPAQSALFSRLRGTRPKPLDATDPVLNIFVGGFSGEYSQDPTDFSFTAHTYDATWLALYGSARSLQIDGAVSGIGIARGLRRVSSGTAIDVKPSSFMPIVEAFSSADGGINIRGASGQLDYHPLTEETTAPVEIWHIVEVTMGSGNYEIQPITTTL